MNNAVTSLLWETYISGKLTAPVDYSSHIPQSNSNYAAGQEILLCQSKVFFITYPHDKHSKAITGMRYLFTAHYKSVYPLPVCNERVPLF